MSLETLPPEIQLMFAVLQANVKPPFSVDEQKYYTTVLNSILPSLKGEDRPFNPSRGLLEAVKVVMGETKEATLPTIARMCMKMQPCRCTTLPDYENLVLHWICEFGDTPHCSEVDAIYEYKIIMKRYPQVLEFIEYLQDRMAMDRDPEAYYQKTRHATPTPHLSSLKEHKRSPEDPREDWGCCMCMEEVESSFYRLPCGHIFHSKPVDCLGDKTVLFWLKSNRKCPNCQQEVKLEETSTKETLSPITSSTLTSAWPDQTSKETGERPIKKHKS